ncbi:hypothetical protein SAMN04488113_12340 [Alkalibacterium gilvum]|uniref:Uncharacterized protein n=1 Tax=Alkalibacterium gilvum TaxID=1130080 RepID=A0A1H6TS58_9LACT|nr:hypothetical protein [Alkalibacterium gilvum]SEI82851.1 hypothetical protein SAMN04488113_12340 [Alkalibacterium gilvum]
MAVYLLLVLAFTVLLYCVYAIMKLQKDIKKLNQSLWNDEYSIERNTHNIEALAWDVYLLSCEDDNNTQEE